MPTALLLLLLFLGLWRSAAAAAAATPPHVVSCERPPVGGGLTVFGLPDGDGGVPPKVLLVFSCETPGELLNGSMGLFCGEDGRWDHPFPSCYAPGDCQRAPPLSNGDMVSTNQSVYRHGEQVEYACQRLYVMEGGPFRRCQDAQWTGDIRCIGPCILDWHMLERRNITFKHMRDVAVHVRHNEAMEFRCDGAMQQPSGDTPMIQTCSEGHMTLPSCV